MKNRRNPSLVLGGLLILAGGYFLAAQYFPQLRFWETLEFAWPWYVVGIGILLLLFGLVLGAPGMAVPAVIVGGIGCLLYWQEINNNYESWAYAWTLIPGFVGLGIMLEGLLEGNLRQALRGGVPLVIISAILFIIFSSFLGGPNLIGPYWPVLLILLGAWLMIRALFRKR